MDEPVAVPAVGRGRWRTLRVLAADERASIGAGLALAAMSGFATAGSPILAGRALDALLGQALGPLLWLCGALGALTVVKYLADRSHGVRLRASGERIMHRLRCDALAKALSLPTGYHDGEGTGMVTSRLTTDVDRMAEFVAQGLVRVVSALCLLVSAVVLLATTASVLALPLLLAAPPLALSAFRYVGRADKAYAQTRAALAATLDRLSELLDARSLLAFRPGTAREVSQLVDVSAVAADTERRADRLACVVVIGVGVALAAALAGTLTLGAVLVARGDARAGEVVGVVLVLRLLMEAAETLLATMSLTVAAGASLERVVALIETPNSLADASRPRRASSVPTLRVHSVSFRYHPDVPLFDDIELALDVCQTIALVGPTGSGKSTLASLLARIRDPQAGSVRYGGVDLRELRLRDVRSLIALLPQGAHIFGASITENILLGRPGLRRVDAERALDRLGSLRRFRSMKGGLDCRVTHEELSSGERQLIGLARVALSEARVLLLDEPTAQLDADQATHAQTLLAEMATRRIVATITHRRSTALAADRAIVLDAGRIVQDGPPPELLLRSGLFAELYRR